jgi:membrane-associated protein
MSGILDHILTLNPALLLSIVGLVVFAEDAIFVGFLIPGETAAVLAGVAAFSAGVQLWIAIVVVVLAAILGDSVGYEVGKHLFGPKVLDSKMLVKHRSKVEAAQEFLRRRGGAAVFLGRFTAFFRAMMPALAGASKMPYRTFLAWNAAGGIIWGTGFVVLGYLAGNSYKSLESKFGHYIAYAVAGIVIVAAIVWKIRSERSEPKKSKDSAPAVEVEDANGVVDTK